MMTESTMDMCMTESTLPEEPPLVPPSLYNDEGVAGTEIRSSFLFQSSCYLPEDDGTESGASGKFSQCRSPKHQEKGDSTGEGMQVIVPYKRRVLDPKKVAFKEPLSVCEESQADSSRGFRINVPQPAGQSTVSTSNETAVQSRAGVSTLTLETSFLSHLFPKSRLRQSLCAGLILFLIVCSLIVAVTCGTGNCHLNKNKDSSSATENSNSSTAITPAPVITELPTVSPSTMIITPDPVVVTDFPTSSPSTTITPAPVVPELPTSSPSLRGTTPAPKVFLSTQELYIAVDDYLETNNNRSMSKVALEYGFPIEAWDVSQLFNLSFVFDARRNPLAVNFRENLAKWDTAKVVTMEALFRGAESFNSDISNWNTSSVTNMKETMALTNRFNQDLSPWDVSRVTTMDSMFRRARAFNGDLKGWNTSAVQSTARMFLNSFMFEGQGLDTWDTSNVGDMMAMFTNTPSFNGDLSKWNVARVTNMNMLFRQAASFNSDLSGWDISSVTDISEMFMHAMRFNADISSWNTSSVTDMSFAFFGASSFTVDISSWDVRNVLNLTKMVAGAVRFDQDLCSWRQRLPSTGKVITRSMFLASGCPNKVDPDPNNLANSQFCRDCDATLPTSAPTSSSGFDSNKNRGFVSTEDLYEAVDKYLSDSSIFSLTNLIYGHPIGSWDVSQVTDFSRVFDASRNKNASTFNEDLRWDTSAAVSMDRTFSGASRFNGDVSTWSTGRVTTMSGMFKDTFEFQGILSLWNTSSCTDMSSMFEGADLFNDDLSSWDTSAVVDMSSMFHSALSFAGNGLSGWDTSSVVTMRELFEEAFSFEADLSSWQVSSVVDMSEIFQYSPFNGDISSWDVARVESFFYSFSGAGSFNRDLADWNVTSATNLVGMFLGARGFSQNLCAWGPKLPASGDVVTSGMFVSSACLNTDDPDPANLADGPFCGDCTQ